MDIAGDHLLAAIAVSLPSMKPIRQPGSKIQILIFITFIQ